MPTDTRKNIDNWSSVSNFQLKLLVLLSLLVLIVCINILLFNVVDFDLGSLWAAFPKPEPLAVLTDIRF